MNAAPATAALPNAPDPDPDQEAYLVPLRVSLVLALLGKLIGYGKELAAIIGRKVDFCSRLHPLIFSRVKDELFPVYERA